MKSCLLLMLTIIGVQVSFGQQYVSYKPVTKSSGEVFEVSPSRKLDKINNNKAELENNSDNKKNVFNINYTISENKDFKYNTHIEGQIKECGSQQPISHAFISLNSALEQGKFIVVATNTEGYFNIDVTDDYVGGITLFKKGYSDKELPLVAVSDIDTKKLYTISNGCLVPSF